ncbi:DUF6913 domain-containing protein [Flavobacterium sp. RHBU_24]|uniref:DUF6913 domain-containing protein n=1 Tax=Flavobacterium sp. RHBU_24 TaxID=3391185 RepID=UPI00398566EC
MKFIKDFNLKKIVNKTLSNYTAPAAEGKIKTVGVIIDETYFAEREKLIQEIASHGIAAGNIETLSFFERVKKDRLPTCCYFTYSDITAGGIYTKDDVNQFINKPFDLLISYYDVQKPPLSLATLKSKALFKAGFSTVNNRFNAFMIAGRAEDFKGFISELFKYIVIFNKL